MAVTASWKPGGVDCARCSGSLGHVRCHLLLQTLGEAVVEEEELAVREQAAEQSVDSVAPQQDLEGKSVVSDDPARTL